MRKTQDLTALEETPAFIEATKIAAQNTEIHSYKFINAV